MKYFHGFSIDDSICGFNGGRSIFRFIVRQCKIMRQIGRIFPALKSYVENINRVNKFN